jgi:hypothetical protein
MSQFCAQGSADSRGRKRVSWRRDPVILDRLPKVERLHLAGRTHTAIAVQIGISEATVRDDLKRIQELWRERAGLDIADQRAQILAELDDTRRRALDAAEWDQACEAAVLFSDVLDSPAAPEPAETDAGLGVSTSANPPPARRTVHRDAKGSAQFRGNKAAALGVARAATMDKAKLLGLVVDKVAPTNSQGEDITLDELMERFNKSTGQLAAAPAEDGA